MNPSTFVESFTLEACRHIDNQLYKEIERLLDELEEVNLQKHRLEMDNCNLVHRISLVQDPSHRLATSFIEYIVDKLPIITISLWLGYSLAMYMNND